MDNKEQLAKELYLESATLQNDFKPLSFVRLEEELKKKGVQVGKSTLQRWSEKGEWKKELDFKAQTILSRDVSILEKLPRGVLREQLKTEIVNIQRNELLTSYAYDVMESFLAELKGDVEIGKKLNRNDVKLAMSCALLTTGRTDRMLDREASKQGISISASEVNRELENAKNSFVIDLED